MPVDKVHGAVAIHRWFVNGEGWSYHPWFQTRIHDLLVAVKPEFEGRGDLRNQNGAKKAFVLEAMGGYLLGIQEHDMKCLDPKAAERLPTILRVAFLQEKPDVQETEKLANALADFHAERAGPNESLKLPLRQMPSACGSEMGWGPWRMRRFIIAIIAVLGIVGLVAMSQIIGRKVPQPEEELRAAREKMVKLLNLWQLNKEEKKGAEEDAFKISRRFLETLSQDGLGVVLEGNHPDVRFLSRMPKKGSHPQNTEQLRSALEGLLNTLKGTKKMDKSQSPSNPLTLLLDEIGQEMNYRLWWDKHGKALDFAASERVNAKAGEFARRFLAENDSDRSKSSWQRPAAEAMLKELTKWKVEAITLEDVDRRPWLIFHCYFQMLSQHHFQPEDLREECWQVEFIKRLPRTSLTGDGTFASEDDLVQALRRLADHLRAERSNSVSTLVTNISSSMDYARWKEQADKVIHREVEKGPPKVDRFVVKFCSPPTDRVPPSGSGGE